MAVKVRHNSITIFAGVMMKCIDEQRNSEGRHDDTGSTQNQSPVSWSLQNFGFHWPTAC